MSIVDDVKEAFSGAMDKLDSRLGGMEKSLHVQTTILKGGKTKKRSRYKLSGVTNAAKEDVSQTFTVPAGEQWILKSQVFQPLNPIATVVYHIVEGQLANVAALNPQDNVYSAGGIGAQGVVTVLADILLRENVTYTIYVITGEVNVPWYLSIDVEKEHLLPSEATTVGTDD